MSSLGHVRSIGAALASLLIVACAAEAAPRSDAPAATVPSSSAAGTSPTTTDPAAETIPPVQTAAADREVLAADVASINEAQRSRTASTDRFSNAETSLVTLVEAYEALYAADLDVWDGLLDELDGDIADPILADARVAFVDATRALQAETRAIADRLAQNRERLDATSTFGAPAPELADMAQEQADAVTQWQTSCFAFQSVLVGVVDEPIDCVGVDRPPSVTAADDSSAEVGVTVDCLHGIGIDTLPFDPAPYALIANSRPDQGWILRSLTIENPTDDWIRLDDTYRYQFYDVDGSPLITTDAPEAFPEGLTAAPGQTIHRNGFAMEDFLRGRRGEALSPDLLEKVFRQSVSCDIIDTTVVTVDPADLVDDEFIDHVEIVGCAADEASGRWLVDYEVTNPYDQPIRVEISTELVDGEGNRQGMAGIGDSDGRIGAGETVRLQGWSVFYTIEDLSAVERCEQFAVRFALE